MKNKLVIRLVRFGRKHNPFYRLGVCLGYKATSAIEYLGSYDPKSKILKVNKESLNKWLEKNIKITNTVKSILTKNSFIKK